LLMCILDRPEKHTTLLFAIELPNCYFRHGSSGSNLLNPQAHINDS